MVAQRRAEQDADPVAEGAGPGGGDPGRLTHRAAGAVGADDVPGPDRGGRPWRGCDAGQHSAVGGMQPGQCCAVPQPGSGGGRALGEDGFEVVLRARPHVVGEGHALDLRARKAGADRHGVLAMEAEAPHFRLGPPAAHQLHGLRSQRGCPRIAPRSRAALEDQRCESPAGQLQRGRKPCGPAPTTRT